MSERTILDVVSFFTGGRLGDAKTCEFEGCTETDICSCGYCDTHHYMSIPWRLNTFRKMTGKSWSTLEQLVTSVDPNSPTSPATAEELALFAIAIRLLSQNVPEKDIQFVLRQVVQYKE